LADTRVDGEAVQKPSFGTRVIRKVVVRKTRDPSAHSGVHTDPRLARPRETIR